MKNEKLSASTIKTIKALQAELRPLLALNSDKDVMNRLSELHRDKPYLKAFKSIKESLYDKPSLIKRLFG